MLFLDGFKSQIKHDILNLGADVDEIEFQDEQSINPPYLDFPHHIPAALPQALTPEKQHSISIIKQRKKKRKDPTCFVSHYRFDNDNRTDQYLFILGHYEQLGKTTVNLLHSGMLAAYMGRNLVIPLVRNSRFCGLRSGWTGPKRKQSREFIPMDNYFDMHSVEHLFREHVFTKQNSSMLSTLPEFYNACVTVGMTIIFFMYSGTKAESKRYMKLSEEEYILVENRMKENNGWADCLFVEKKLQVTKRMNYTKVNSAFCVDPEIMQSRSALKELVHTHKCVIVFLWRGVGFQRTHFNITLPNSHEAYLSHLQSSHFIVKEVQQFLDFHVRGVGYLSIHIRSERQIIWYGVEKFKKCMKLVIEVVNILIEKKKIRHIFISSDLESHGSDSLSKVLNKTTLNDTKQFYQNLVSSLNTVRYKADKRKGIIYNDAGFVALTEMEIMSRSSHLITLGAGTFQGWLVALFKKYQNMHKRAWSLTRVCSVEIKNPYTRHKKVN